MSFDDKENAPPRLYDEDDRDLANDYTYKFSNPPVPSEAELKEVHSSATTGNTSRTLQKRKKRKDDSLFGVIREWVVEHQIGLSLNLLILHALAHIFFPRLRQRTRSFFRLSYYSPTEGAYRRGPEDLYFVAYWIVIFTGLRASVMTYVLLPWAKYAGLRTAKAKTRFAEQAWQLIYWSSSSAVGLYIMYHSLYWLNLSHLWKDWPIVHVDGLTKWYYLVQFAFWLQQIVVVNIEERRKDHWQMFTHHIITCALLLASYGFYHTQVGNVILVLMDFVDIFLAGAKVLKYHGYNTACDLAFTAFIIAWFLSRHVAYNIVCYSVYRDIPLYIPSGRYSTVTGELLSSSLASPANETNKNAGKEILYNVLQPYLRPGGDIYFHRGVTLCFLIGLLALQAICMVWFAMIIRVAYRVIKGVGAEDVRSDDEDEGEDEEDEDDIDDEENKVVNLNSKNTPPWQQAQHGLKRDMLPHPHHISSVHGKTVSARGSNERLALGNSSSTGVAVNGVQRRRRVGSPAMQRPSSKRKVGAGGQGGPLSLADRKDLLGRIGCDKPT